MYNLYNYCKYLQLGYRTYHLYREARGTEYSAPLDLHLTGSKRSTSEASSKFSRGCLMSIAFRY